MSVPVAIEQLREETHRFGPAPYLLTVAADGRPHAVSVSVSWDGDRLVAGVGTRTAANARDRRNVSLLWPPYEAGGYSLIVDGTASVISAEAGEQVAVQPTRAVLHRSQPSTNPASSCTSDCVPIIR